MPALTVTLLFAGGTSRGSPDGAVPKSKALLPVYGQPIANHVIRALEQSTVEKIFIIHEQDACLEHELITGPKCVFIACNGCQGSIGSSIFVGLEKVAQYYPDPDEIQQKKLLLVPCDIPLVTSQQFNTLIEKAASNQADFIMTIISEDVIKNRFPQRRFRTGYLADYKSRFTVSMIGFVNGKIIRLTPAGERHETRISFAGVREDHVTRVMQIIDIARTHRHHNFLLPRFTEKLALIWLLRRGFITPLLRLFFDLACRRLTLPRLANYVSSILQVNTSCIVSEDPEFSADIDRPEDFPIILGIPWEN